MCHRKYFMLCVSVCECAKNKLSEIERYFRRRKKSLSWIWVNRRSWKPTLKMKTKHAYESRSRFVSVNSPKQIVAFCFVFWSRQIQVWNPMHISECDFFYVCVCMWICLSVSGSINALHLAGLEFVSNFPCYGDCKNRFWIYFKQIIRFMSECEHSLLWSFVSTFISVCFMPKLALHFQLTGLWNGNGKKCTSHLTKSTIASQNANFRME